MLSKFQQNLVLVLTLGVFGVFSVKHAINAPALDERYSREGEVIRGEVTYSGSSSSGSGKTRTSTPVVHYDFILLLECECQEVPKVTQVKKVGRSAWSTCRQTQRKIEYSVPKQIPLVVDFSCRWVRCL